jgi:hypothetical protein|tara:strand:- start:393 stop:533 length:141 start_codon:yes stop_codon:yes gene_type:complete
VVFTDPVGGGPHYGLITAYLANFINSLSTMTGNISHLSIIIIGSHV